MNIYIASMSWLTISVLYVCTENVVQHTYEISP